MKALVLLEIDTERAEVYPETLSDLALQVRKMIENNSDWSAFDAARVELVEASEEHDERLISEYTGQVHHGAQLARDMLYMLNSSEGGDYRWRSEHYPQDRARESVQAYAAWLLACAGNAR